MHGGRTGRSTHEPIISQILLFDTARQTKTGLVCMNLDAESCYDRMMPNYGTIALTRLGLPQSIGVTLAKKPTTNETQSQNLTWGLNLFNKTKPP